MWWSGSRLAKAAALAFALFLAVVIYWAVSGSMPPVVQALYKFPGGDKVGHFVLMGSLAFLVNLAFAKRTLCLAGQRVLAGSALVALVVSLEELSQFAFPRRTPDLLDWAASMLGIWAAGAFLRLLPDDSSKPSSSTL